MHATILIDSGAVDIRSVVARPEVSGSTAHKIEVRFPSRVVLHELQESCDPSLTEDKLQPFLESDSQDWRGREAYLVMARAVAGIPSSTKLAGPFHWAWTKTSHVSLEGSDVRFIGEAAAI